MTWATYLAVWCPLIAAVAYVIAAGGHLYMKNPWMALSFICWAIANLGLAIPALR